MTDVAVETAAPPVIQPWTVLVLPGRVLRAVAGGTSFISASGLTGFEVAGTIVGSFIGAAVGLTGLGLVLVDQHRRTERRRTRAVRKAFGLGWNMRGETLGAPQTTPPRPDLSDLDDEVDD